MPENEPTTTPRELKAIPAAPRTRQMFGRRIRYDANLQADEQEWLMVTAQICFFRRVQQSVNTLTGYSTDALTITNSDKPYANLQATLRDLENQQRVLYYKMARFNLL